MGAKVSYGILFKSLYLNGLEGLRGRILDRYQN